MEKKINRLANVSLLGFILITLSRIIIVNKAYSVFGYATRKWYFFFTDFFYLPIVIITSAATLFVLYYYCLHRFRIPLKHFYLIIPGLIYIVICICALLGFPAADR